MAAPRAAHALVFAVDAADEVRAKREAVLQQIVQAGLELTLVTTPSGLRQAVLVSASEQRLEQEAERQKISLRLAGVKMLFAEFIPLLKEKYALKDGELFSQLERQRLVVGVIEGAKNAGGAELDLDGLVAEGIFLASMALHSKEREILWSAWCGFQLWPRGWPHGWPKRKEWAQHSGSWPLTATSNAHRALPDFGLVQQPLHAVQAYFGSKIAFYFAWAETYTCWLLAISYVAVPLEVLRASAEGGTTDAMVRLTFCVILGVSATFLNEVWGYKQMLLGFTWNVLDLDRHDRPRPEYLKAAREGIWRLEEYGGRPWRAMMRLRGFFTGQGIFVDDDTANEVFVMQRCARFAVYVIAFISLAIILSFNIVTTLAILTFQMITQQAHQIDDQSFFREHGKAVCAVILTINVILSNVFYKSVAVFLTDVENQRTEGDYEDSLLIKTTLFQFVNSYFAPFYIALVKSQGLVIFGAFGYRNRRGELYKDYCGAIASNSTPYARVTDCSASVCISRYLFVREDCMDELQTLMISYLILKPILENLKTLFMPLINRSIARWRRVRRRQKAAAAAAARGNAIAPERSSPAQYAATSVTQPNDAQKLALAAKISDEMSLLALNGTFGEFDTKILQYGYVTFFSVAFPLGAIFAAIANIFELRLDAYKHTWASRRPAWEGADGIGNWGMILRAYAWLALLVNVLLLGYAAHGVRDYLIVPFVADFSDSNCPTALTASSLSDESIFWGLNISWETSCARNFRNCFVDIGTVEWLPANDYLDSSFEITQPYHQEGLCNKNSTLFNQQHYDLCKERIADVQYALLLFVVLLEHILIALKLFVLWFLPDKPISVRKEEARSAYARDKMLEMAALRT